MFPTFELIRWFLRHGVTRSKKMNKKFLIYNTQFEFFIHVIH